MDRSAIGLPVSITSWHAGLHTGRVTGVCVHATDSLEKATERSISFPDRHSYCCADSCMINYWSGMHSWSEMPKCAGLEESVTQNKGALEE